jgi:hypothetical protein
MNLAKQLSMLAAAALPWLPAFAQPVADDCARAEKAQAAPGRCPAGSRGRLKPAGRMRGGPPSARRPCHDEAALSTMTTRKPIAP